MMIVMKMAMGDDDNDNDDGDDVDHLIKIYAPKVGPFRIFPKDAFQHRPTPMWLTELEFLNGNLRDELDVLLPWQAQQSSVHHRLNSFLLLSQIALNAMDPHLSCSPEHF